MVIEVVGLRRPVRRQRRSPRCYRRVATVTFPFFSTTKNPAELQPGKVSMDYGKLSSQWKRLVCCPSQCQIQTGKENASLSRSRLPVNGNRMERGQRGWRPVWARLNKGKKREMFPQICTIFPSDLKQRCRSFTTQANALSTLCGINGMPELIRPPPWSWRSTCVTEH